MTHRPIFLSRTARMRQRLLDRWPAAVIGAATAGWVMFLLERCHG